MDACRRRIEDCIPALRAEADKVINGIARAIKQGHDHNPSFLSALRRVSECLHDNGAVRDIIATGDVDLRMNGRGFSSFLRRDDPDYQALRKAYNAVFHVAEKVRHQLWLQDLDWRYMVEGTLLQHQPSVQDGSLPDGGVAIEIHDVPRIKFGYYLPLILLEPPHEWSVDQYRGDLESRTEAMRSVLAETLLDDEDSEEGSSLRSSVAEALLGSEEVLGRMRRQKLLRSNASRVSAPVDNKKLGLPTSSLRLAVALKELTINGRDPAIGPYEKVPPGSAVLAYMPSLPPGRSLFPASHHSICSASELPAEKLALAGSLACVFSEPGKVNGSSLERVADGLSFFLDNLLDGWNEIYSTAPSSPANM